MQNKVNWLQPTDDHTKKPQNFGHWGQYQTAKTMRIFESSSFIQVGYQSCQLTQLRVNRFRIQLNYQILGFFRAALQGR